MPSEPNYKNGKQSLWSSPWFQLPGIGLVGVLLGILLASLWPQAASPFQQQPTFTPTRTITPRPTMQPTEQPPPTIPPTASQTPASTPTSYLSQFQPSYGILALSIQVQGTYQLFLYQPFPDQQAGSLAALPLVQITTGPGDKIHPALSPDGNSLAYASDQDGTWDIYLQDLTTGAETNLTDTNSYHGHPSWSPDGQWLTYEAYQENNLEIFIQAADGASSPINLSNHPAPDYWPHWSGQGRKISFLSAREGEKQVMIADLDLPREEKTTRLNLPAVNNPAHPTWSPDGRYLSLSARGQNGLWQIYLRDTEAAEQSTRLVGQGSWPCWGSGGDLVYTAVDTPSHTYLTAYPLSENGQGVMLPAVQLPGRVRGISWAEKVPLENISAASPGTISPSLENQGQETADGGAGQRLDLVRLPDIQAPSPKLNPRAAEAFQTLRERTARKAGWDFLGTLANAYLPLTSPPDPGQGENWLYTGRAFEVSELPLLAEWMVVVREEYGAVTYWRLYLRAKNQDGSQGRPLYDYPWDFQAQYSGNPRAYEAGGRQRETVPEGYWIDFTELAAGCGWSRFPASPLWRTALPTSNWQLFAFQEGLNWREAMLEIYPPAALITPTPYP